MEPVKSRRRGTVREEQNLIEIPLGVLSDRDRRKTLELSDTIKDRATGKYVHRKWTVSGSDKWGLPHGVDHDVCLALQKLTFEKDCLGEGSVPFSIRELNRELKSPTGGFNNNRMKKSLERIVGVTIACENSWRKNDRWVSLDAFHILERLCLSNTKEKFDPDEEQRIKWNEVILQSMRVGHMTKFDWEFYLGLKSAVSKRLYRFLRKRFHHQDGCTYQVIPFCENKMAMWHKRKTNYRHALMVAIDELMKKGVLPRVSEEKMFSGKGKHQQVVFRKPSQLKGVEVKPQPTGKIPNDCGSGVSPLALELVSRGMRQREAVHWAKTKPEEVRRQVEHFDFRINKGWRPSRSAGGYLNTAIETQLPPPHGFVFKADLEEQKRQKEATEASTRAEKAKVDNQVEVGRKKLEDRGRVVTAHLSKLSEEEQRKLVDAAFNAAPASLNNRIGRDSEMTRVNVVFKHLQKSSST